MHLFFIARVQNGRAPGLTARSTAPVVGYRTERGGWHWEVGACV